MLVTNTDFTHKLLAVWQTEKCQKDENILFKKNQKKTKKKNPQKTQSRPLQ